MNLNHSVCKNSNNPVNSKALEAPGGCVQERPSPKCRGHTQPWSKKWPESWALGFTLRAVGKDRAGTGYASSCSKCSLGDCPKKSYRAKKPKGRGVSLLPTIQGSPNCWGPSLGSFANTDISRRQHPRQAEELSHRGG